MNEAEVRFIKQAAIGYSAVGGDTGRKLSKAVEWLYRDYKRTGDHRSIEAARITLEAYMQMGFTYLPHRETFDQVMEELNEDAQIVFRGRIYPQAEVKATKANIRSLLGNWPRAAKKEDSVSFAVDDIWQKIQEGADVFCFYQCKKNGNIFELIIVTGQCYFVNARTSQITHIVR